ncbi:MAG: CBS domain-containing protein [Wenzhouxiangella sp.]
MKKESAPQAQDFMTRKVKTVSPGLCLEEAIAFLKRHKVSNAPVVEEDADGHRMLIGFLSEADCLEHLATEVFYGSPAPQQTVRTMMKLHPVCIEPDMDVFTLASIFTNHGYRHLPVAENGRLLGIVSRRDILHALNDHYREVFKDRKSKKFRPNLSELINHRFILRR